MSARLERESPMTAIRGVLFPLTLCAFIALRLAGVTHWSWWWVLSPLWIGAAFLLVVAGALVLPFAALALYARIRIRFRLRQSFPEAFINPAAWSRAGAGHPHDSSDSLRRARPCAAEP
jgi:hypothetical protein